MVSGVASALLADWRLGHSLCEGKDTGTNARCRISKGSHVGTVCERVGHAQAQRSCNACKGQLIFLSRQQTSDDRYEENRMDE